MNHDRANRFLESLANARPTFIYIAKRLLLMVPVLIIMSFVIFMVINQMPGDPVNMYLNPEEVSHLEPAEVQALRDYWREQLGLDDPLPIRFAKWWGTILQGDFGMSVIKNDEVSNFIGSYLMNTFRLNVIGFILAFILAIIIGIQSAVRKNSFFDRFFTVFSIIGISLPNFFMAMLLIYVFSILLRVLPISGMADPLGIRGTWTYYVLPISVIILTSLAVLVRYVRNAMLEVLKQDYIRTARSKGLREKVVIYRHAFRNALIPVITLIGFYIPALFSGSIIVEKIFVWPGIGFLLNSAYAFKDRAIITSVALFFALLTLLANLFMDVGYALVDPRVRLGGDS